MFTHRWIVCIFSYNRGALLQNLLASVGQFYPEFDIVVFDDSSNDPATQHLLASLALQHIKVISSNRRSDDSKHGGLYAQMNKALQYGIEHGYNYAYFVQDDMQFLWRDETLENRVQAVFEHDECVMCNYNFLRKILTEGIEDRLVLQDNSMHSFEGFAVADTGIINLTKAKKMALHFPEQSEHGNGKYWYDKGYRMYWLPTAHLAWVPWPTTYRNEIKEQRKARVLYPLTETAITKLKANTSYSYLEDYTKLQGWALKPYWYTNNPGWVNLMKIYIKYHLKRLF